MNAEERRARIASRLRESAAPVSATALAGELGVSRQIIVGDVALLRAGGEDIMATPRGYVLARESGGYLCRVACRHTAEEMGRELDLIVDNGCTVLDVVVEHPVYGQITGPLQLSSRYDVEQFLAKVRSEKAQPLSALTHGIHLHTLRCPDEASAARVKQALDRAGFLVKE